MRISEPNKRWQLADYQQFTKLLDQLLALDKTTLPRAGSPYSSGHFDQLTELALPSPEADFQARLLAYERLKALPQRFLLYYYEPNRNTQRFGAEVLRLHLAEWQVRQYGYALLRDMPKSLESAQLRNYQRTELAAYTLGVEALLHLYEVDYGQYASADLHDCAKRLYYLLNAMPKGELRTTTAMRLGSLARQFPDARVREALKACYRACR